MSGRIIPLRGDPHDEVQRLLPWFVTGRLDAAELSLVESHLSQCAECRADAASERRLRDEVQTLPAPPVEIESGWALMQARVGSDQRRLGRMTGWLGRLRAGARGVMGGAPAWMGWALAGQAAAILVLAAVVWRPAAPPAAYHVLGAAPVAAGGDVVVIFRPTSPEADIQAALRASHARITDGPTEAGAYVLRVAPEARAGALARLRANAGVEAAEPIDDQGPP